MTWKPTPPPFAKYKKEVFLKNAKVSQFIYQIGEYPELRKKSRIVPLGKIKSSEYKEKFAYIKNCLLRYRKLTGMGRGITAVQIGIPERFSVVYTPEKLLILINPRVTKKSNTVLEFPEMCMSASPIIAPTRRPAWVEFEYYDENGTKKLWNTRDNNSVNRVLNRVFLHELDHIDGIINIDLAKSSSLTLESDPNFYNTAKFKEV